MLIVLALMLAYANPIVVSELICIDGSSSKLATAFVT